MLVALLCAGCATQRTADIRVNVAPEANLSMVRSRPGSSAAFGYYGYRYGLYDAWPMYDRDVDTVTYPIGTANIDVVDAQKRQLIWEGVAEGRLRDEDMENPREAISSAVTQLFTRFPRRASSVDATAGR